MWSISERGAYWVRTAMSLSPEFTALLSAKSMIRYLPPNGTPGLARTWDRIESRSPSPPARMSVRTDGTRRFYGPARRSPASTPMGPGRVPAQVRDRAGHGGKGEDHHRDAVPGACGRRSGRRARLRRTGHLPRRDADPGGRGRPRGATLWLGRGGRMRCRDPGAAQRREAALTGDRRDRVFELGRIRVGILDVAGGSPLAIDHAILERLGCRRPGVRASLLLDELHQVKAAVDPGVIGLWLCPVQERDGDRPSAGRARGETRPAAHRCHGDAGRLGEIGLGHDLLAVPVPRLVDRQVHELVPQVERAGS